MEVNRENFTGVFPKIQHLLQTCDFYSFDLEMTGINPVRTGRRVDPEAIGQDKLPHNCRFYSTPEDSFPGKWEAATTFSPMQLGISIFHKRTSEATIANFRQKLTCRESGLVLDRWIACGKKLDEPLELVAATRKQLGAAVNALPTLRDDDDDLAPVEEATVEATSPVSLPLDSLEAISRFHLLAQELDAVTEFISSHRAESALDDYVAATFHCHLFPSFHYGDATLTMSIETVGTFLSEHNMDFNAWVRNSLLFAPREEVAKARVAALHKAATAGAPSGPKVFNQELLSKVAKADVNTVATVFAILETFAERNRDDKDARQVKALPFVNSSDAFSAITSKAKSLGLRVERGDIFWSPTPSTGGASSNEKHQANLLFEAMINSKKPVIVHNCWSDLLFLYRAFHSTPLRTYQQFKRTLRTLFPVLYDTRTLSSLDINQRLGQVRGQLDRTYQAFKREHEAKSVRITMTDGFTEGNNAAHNAGYDAFITGSLFLYASAEMKQHENLALEHFNGILPVYASVFSISLHTDHDYLVHAPSSPIFYCIPGAQRGGAFADRLSSIFYRENLPSIAMNCGDSALLFVTGSARGTGSLLNSSVTASRKEVAKQLTGAKVIDMEIDKFIAATNGKIQFLPLGY
jgi:hypothetical protein